jgi:hypothetical protein
MLCHSTRLQVRAPISQKASLSREVSLLPALSQPRRIRAAVSMLRHPHLRKIFPRYQMKCIALLLLVTCGCGLVDHVDKVRMHGASILTPQCPHCQNHTTLQNLTTRKAWARLKWNIWNLEVEMPLCFYSGVELNLNKKSCKNLPARKDNF